MVLRKVILLGIWLVGWPSSVIIRLLLLLQLLYSPLNIYLNHTTIIQIGIKSKKIPCYMRGPACKWPIVENVKIFWSYVKYLWNLLWVTNTESQLVSAKYFLPTFQQLFLTKTIKESFSSELSWKSLQS